VSLEDAWLLLEPLDEVMKDLEYAEARLEKHLDMEAKRTRAGLPTDRERLAAGEEVSDVNG